MSSRPNPVSETTAPFEQTTTPTIDRANRLMSLRSHPGFGDLIRLSQSLVQEAVEICSDYPGWDPQQIVVLKVRMQTAKEHHQRLLSRMQDAIREGIEEAKTSTLPAKTADEAIDQGDYVRQAVLQKFEEQDARVAGSY